MSDFSICTIAVIFLCAGILANTLKIISLESYMKGLTPEAATKLVVTYNQKINQGV